MANGTLFPLDLRKNKVDKYFLDSYGQKPAYTNWDIDSTYNETGYETDYVMMSKEVRSQNS